MRSALASLTSAAVMALACACSAAPTSDRAEEVFEPYGEWRVVSVDDTPARTAHAEGPGPSVTFRPGGYGGNGGCNGFGGIGVWVEGRWYADPPTMTAMACDGVMDQEMKIAAVLASAPALTVLDGSGMELRSSVGTLVLTRAAPTSASPDPAAESALLAGRQIMIHTVDNGPWRDGSGVRLTFDADRWRLASDCGETVGAWRQDGDRLTLAVDQRDGACDDAAPHRAMRDMAGGEVGFATGPNQEFVIGGSGHWLRGDDRFQPDADQIMIRLAGSWRATHLDDRDIADGDAAPRVVLGPGFYSVWDGCNRTEGLAIVRRGDLFTAGSGLSTLAACRPDETGRRAAAIVTARPRVAWADDGTLVLVGRGGALRLTRTAVHPASAPRPGALIAGMRIDLSDGAGRLHLADGRRFTVTQDCASLTGQWRQAPQLRMFADPPRETAPGCDLGPGSPAFLAGQVLNGDVQAVVDPNGERALIVSDFGALSGRVVR